MPLPPSKRPANDPPPRPAVKPAQGLLFPDPPPAKKAARCVACEGTGRNRNNQACVPCGGTGRQSAGRETPGGRK